MPERPFNAIKNGTKEVEGRVPKSDEENIYKEMKPGDVIEFSLIGTNSKEKLLTEIVYISHYTSFREMLETETPQRVLSSGGAIEEGVESYNSLNGYKDNVKRFGVYAIAIEPIK